MAKNEKTWHLRLKIFDNSGELVADTHPDVHPDASVDTSETCRGLPTALERFSALIHGYHDAPLDSIEGARMRDLVKRVPTLRVYLSQHRGRCAFKIPYSPDGATSWQAFAVIQRDDWTGWDGSGMRPNVPNAAPIDVDTVLRRPSLRSTQ